ncbi:MAG: sigma-54-dependent Fis family transcriptional regulator [Holophagaceae bacterium]|nr:sigma-54-dependent Fis family transcriptional regulator [Holophagaceae bacterium]
MRLILVEDKDSFRKLLLQALEGSPWNIRATGDPLEALDWIEGDGADVLVTDLRLPGFSGLELIRRAKRAQPGLRVVLMSAFGEPKDIVSAMRMGAEDFLPKPFDMGIFLALMDRLQALAGAPPPDPREPWIALSPVMRTLDSRLRAAADSDAPALFIGPRGSGKARAARRLHALRQPRGPFLSVAAPDLSEGIGANTFGLLQGGSLLVLGLEHLGPTGAAELVKAMDTPLGHGIQWMATCGDEAAASDAVRLRLGVLRFELPPLAHRQEDLVPLFRALLEQAAAGEGRVAPVLDRSAEKQVAARDWPGNAREMAWCAQATLHAATGLLVREVAASPLGGVGGDAAGGLDLPWPEENTLESMLRETQHHAEAALLRRALAAHANDPAAAAAALGLTLRAFASRAREHGL